MLFDYQAFKEKLREKPDKKHIIENWEKHSDAQLIGDEPFFEYVNQFKPIPYRVPEELKYDFDWELLLQLVAASFSSDYKFVIPDSDDLSKVATEMLIPELSITVSSGKQGVTKRVSELWSFQILRLYEIYCEEQINLHMLKLEDENEKNAIDCERVMRVKAYMAKQNDACKKIERLSCFL